MLTVGSEAARRRLPELLDRAHSGESSVIEKRGQPYAVLVPLSDVDELAAAREGEGLFSLRGSGEGLWGNDIVAQIEALRDEWR